MTYKELGKFYHEFEDQFRSKDEEIARKVVLDYLYSYGNYEYLFEEPQSSMDELYSIYFKLRRMGAEKPFERIMRDYGFTYTNAIHEAIYNLLQREEDMGTYKHQDPRLFPGIRSIKKVQDGSFTRNILNTRKGKIEVYQASEIYKLSESSYIFKKELIGACYARSLDFIKENKDFKVVVTYLNNHFTKGHFHVHLEREDEEIVDIASNAYYIAKEFSDKVLQGTRLFELTYDEIENFDEKIEDTKEEIPKLAIITASKINSDKCLKKTIIHDSI